MPHPVFMYIGFVCSSKDTCLSIFNFLNIQKTRELMANQREYSSVQIVYINKNNVQIYIYILFILALELNQLDLAYYIHLIYPHFKLF